MPSLRDEVLQTCAVRPEESESQRLLRCAEVLERVCEKNQHADLLNEYLDEHLSDRWLDEDEYKEILTSGRFLIIAQSNDTMIAILRQPYVAEKIYSAPISYAEKNVSSGTVTVDRYSLPDDFMEDCFDDSVRLTKVSSDARVTGAMILKEMNDVIDITEVTELPRISVRIALPLAGQYEWSFSRETLRAVAQTSLSLMDSGVAGMLDLLGSMQSSQTIDVVEKLCEHPQHFVRWKAVQTISKLDPDRGLQLVRRAIDDRHPQIRAAANATLQRNLVASQ